VNCYAEALSLRMGWSAKPWTAQNAAENVKLHPERLDAPLRWRKPRMVFVNSMSDLFHENVPFDFVDQVWDVIRRAGRHTFQVLTKRPDRMLQYFGGILLKRNVLPNLWLGTSIEDQRRAHERTPPLLDTPAAVRFLSVEPLLERVRFPLPCKDSRFWGGIHWVIIGGESGRGYREMRPEWVEEIAGQCARAGVACFVKQDSGLRPGKQGRLSDALWARKEYPPLREMVK
jgi:protein gp37